MSRSRIATRIAPIVAVLATTLPVSAFVQIDPDPAGLIQNETSLTMIPGQPGLPLLLAVGYNNDPTNATGLGVGLSTTGGASWTTLALPLALDPGGSGFPMTDAFDPAAGADLLGNVFFAQISTLGGYPGASGLFVHRYDHWAGTWFPPVTVSYSPAATGNPDPFYRFNDKCHLAVDLDPLNQSNFANRVYVAWIQDGGLNMGPFSDIFFAWSTDQGATWNYPGGSPVPVPINDNPYIPLGPPSDMANGPNIVVSPAGPVYVAWMDVDVSQPQATGNLMINVSPDGGMTWTPDVLVAGPVLCCPRNLNGQSDARARSFPCLGVAPGVNAGGFYDLYCVYPADPDGPGPDEADIFFTRSTNGGLVWTAPIRVNNDATTTDQFQPWMDVKPDGTIDIAWYDRRMSASDQKWDVCISRCLNGGQSFARELLLTWPTDSFATPQMPWGEAWMGEYLGLAVDETHAYLAFTSSISDNLGDVYYFFLDNVDIPTAIGELPGGERGSELELRFANPFRAGGIVVFALPEEAAVKLAIYDVEGRVVRTLADEVRRPGAYGVPWDGRDGTGRVVASGVYFCRYTAGERSVSRKITLVR